jgi:vancomycin resistance protein YoaR
MKNKLKLKLRLPIIVLLSLVVLTAGSYTLYHFYFLQKSYPGITVNGVDIGGKDAKEGTAILTEKIKNPEKLSLKIEDKNFDINLQDLNFNYDYSLSAQQAVNLYKTDFSYQGLMNSLVTFKTKPNLLMFYQLDEKKLEEYLSLIDNQVSKEPVYPEVTLVSGKIKVEKGQAGSRLEINNLKQIIKNRLANADFSQIEFKPTIIDPTLSDTEIQSITDKANSFVGKNIKAVAEENTINITGTDIATLLSPTGFSDKRIALLIAKLTEQINRSPQNAVFRFENGKVMEFLPAKDGYIVDKEQFQIKLTEALNLLDSGEEKTTTISVPINKTAPKTMTSDVNDLGINELIGKGESRFAGSISSRIYNVNLAASKFNGVLIPPGETLSFNKILGDVSALTGYKQAYIIRNGQTVLGDGGGVCQVSTTLFRAALNAGLPILERRAHAYRVGYYEQGSPPGLDATVYDPTTDFKIKNDTEKYILIQTKTDTKNLTLVFELYGTSDGRKSTITKPATTNSTPPPEDLYIDDPTLPSGTVKQIDWKAWGAKVTFKYSVEKNGNKIYEKTFVSNYQPWQAKFLRGTKTS